MKSTIKDSFKSTYLKNVRLFLRYFRASHSCSVVATLHESGRELAEKKMQELLKEVDNRTCAGTYHIAPNIEVKARCIPDLSIPRDAFKLVTTLVISGNVFGDVSEVESLGDTLTIWANGVGFIFRYAREIEVIV